MATKTKQPTFQKTYTSPIFLILAALLLVVGGWAVYETSRNHSSLPTTSKLAYVDGNDAVEQVSNFYHQYLSETGKPDFQKHLISVVGDQNLVFYNDYYQHGFNPITCSTVTPTNVTASLVSTGPVATVKALATYPDHTTAAITAKVVLSDKLAIDSITCPGDKGNLPPDNTN